MKTYELTYIISTQITSEEAVLVIKDVESFIQQHEGIIISSQKQTPQALAYPVKRQASGYVVTAIVQAPEKSIKTIAKMLSESKNVLRSIILIKRPPKQVKERRTKKPLFAMAAANEKGSVPETVQDKESSKEPAVVMEDIDKQLTQILGE